jgi:hypothetical protein
MVLNIVSGFQSINQFKQSRYFRQNLGVVSTVDKNGRRILNEKDKFSFHYNSQYRTTIYGQGNVGNIKFYLDHYIKDTQFAVYYGDNFEEFLFNLDIEIIKEKGIDFYIGYIIKEVEEKYEEKVKNDELKKSEPKKEGNPDILLQNPGSVTYADLRAYLEKKQKERYKDIK